jgi:flagellar protein FlbD
MIIVTRLNGPAFAVNPDLIERAESTPDTVITLVDGTKFVVSEPVEELIARIRDFRASVIATAHFLEVHGSDGTTDAAQHPLPEKPAHGGTVVHLHRREG